MKKNSFFYLKFFLFFNLFLLPLKADPMFDVGKDIFLNKGMCSTCHMLADAGSTSQIGPNLNQIKPDIMRVITTVTNGIGVMPSYVGELSAEEIESVAYYVSESANK